MATVEYILILATCFLFLIVLSILNDIVHPFSPVVTTFEGYFSILISISSRFLLKGSNYSFIFSEFLLNVYLGAGKL